MEGAGEEDRQVERQEVGMARRRMARELLDAVDTPPSRRLDSSKREADPVQHLLVVDPSQEPFDPSSAHSHLSAMALSDRLVGGVMLFVSAFVFGYYTLWAFLTPFLPSDSALLDLFPPRTWAVRLPALVLVAGLGGIGAFVGKVMMDEEKKRKLKAQRVKSG